LPCYICDLKEGDIAIVEYLDESRKHTFGSSSGTFSKGVHTIYIHGLSYRDLNIISLTKPNEALNGTGRKTSFKVLALVGNTFDSERLTYGVKNYVK